jgi:hypothetical protein
MILIVLIHFYHHCFLYSRIFLPKIKMQNQYSRMTPVEQRRKMAVSVRLSSGQLPLPEHASGISKALKLRLENSGEVSSSSQVGSLELMPKHKSGSMRAVHGGSRSNLHGSSGHLDVSATNFNGSSTNFGTVLPPVHEQHEKPVENDNSNNNNNNNNNNAPSGDAGSADDQGIGIAVSAMPPFSSSEATQFSSASIQIQDNTEIDGADDATEPPVGAAVVRANYSSYASEEVVDA